MIMKVLAKLVYAFYIAVYSAFSASFIVVCLDIFKDIEVQKGIIVSVSYNTIILFTFFIVFGSLIFLAYVLFTDIITCDKVERQLRDFFNKKELPF